jgi:hypothetical protein
MHNKILVERHEEKTPVGRPGHRWEDNMKMDLMNIQWEGMDWFYVAHEGLMAGSYKHSNECLSSIKREFHD